MKRQLTALVCALAFASAAAAQGAPQPAGAEAAAPETIAVAPEQAEAPVQAPSAATLPAPAPSRARPVISTDEGGLWGMSDRAEQEARASGQLESDPALNAYLREVACRVAGPYCGDIRLYVMNRPVFNAMMAPNGYAEVWSGLLLRVEDEAQLAFVLGHEIGHYSERHSLQSLRAARVRSNVALAASLAIAVAGAAASVNSPNSAQLISDLARVSIDAVYLATVASLFAFDRANELEADSIGYDASVNAGYDRQAGQQLWTNLIAESKASNNRDVREEEARASIFRTHPLSADRVEALTARAAQASGGESHRERYRAAIRPFLDTWLRADLRRRDYGQTWLVLDHLAAHGEDIGIIEYYRGEINRIRRADGDRDRAIAHYTNAIAQPDAPAAAWRELGEYAARDTRNAEAAAFFSAYLERAPNAGDRALVEARIAQLTGGGQ